MLMAAPDAASANAANAEAAIEHWAASCELPVALPQGPLQWRGLAVSGWSAEASDDHHLAILRFSPTVKRAEINAVLGSITSRREFARGDCAVPLLRELRDDAGWALVCECAQTAGP